MKKTYSKYHRHVCRKRSARLLLLAGLLFCTACAKTDVQTPSDAAARTDIPVETYAEEAPGTASAQADAPAETASAQADAPAETAGAQADTPANTASSQADTPSDAEGSSSEAKRGAQADAAQELTMDGLIALSANEGLRRFIQEQGLDGFLRYENLKYYEEMPEESLTGLYLCTLPWGDREYSLQIYFRKPETASEYGYEEYEVDSVRLAENQTGDAVLLYSADSRYRSVTDLSAFLEREYGVDQYLTAALPEGFSLGEYQADLAGFAGSLLVGDAEEPLHADSSPQSWYAPGGIGIFPREDYLLFDNGILTDIFFRQNHASILTEPKRLEGCEIQALICEFEFDLFTAAEQEAYRESTGKELSAEDSVSKFWYVFLGEETLENGYVIFLNERYFTREDAIALARSVRLSE